MKYLNNRHKILMLIFFTSSFVSFGQDIKEQIYSAYNNLDKQAYIQNLFESYKQEQYELNKHRHSCRFIQDSVPNKLELPSYVKSGIERFEQKVYYAEKNGIFALNICVADSKNISIDTTSLSFNILCIKDNGAFEMGIWCHNGRYAYDATRFMYMDFRKRVNKDIKRGLKNIIKLSPQYILWSYDLNDNILFLKDDILYVYCFFEKGMGKHSKIHTITDYLQHFGLKSNL